MTDLITDPLFYAVAIPAILLTGIAKTGFPGSFSGIAVPLMALVISPVQAASIMLPVLCLMDLVGLNAFRGSLDKANMPIIITGAALGTALGTATFGTVSESAMLILTGAIALVFALNKLLRVPVQSEPSGPSWRRGVFWSALSGFTSFVTHTGAPPLLVYLLPQQLPKRVFVGTTVVFFLFVNYLKIVPYAWLGQLNLGNLKTSLALAPFIPFGVWLGIWLQGKVNDVLFYKAATWLMLGLGVKLLYDGLKGYF